jgi:checkpoint serine/threonine-protein kinase
MMQKLGEGGFGAVFQAQDLSSKKESADDEDEDEDDDDDADESDPPMVAIKVVKPRNIWEYHILRRLRSSIQPLLRRSVVSPHALYAFRDESFLVLDLCTQGTLLDVVNNASSAGVSQQGACLDELLVVFFTIELLRLLEGIHAAGFIHGDLKIDNCLLRLEDVPGGASAWSGLYQTSGDGGWSSKGLKVIDFGRTIDTRLFPSGQQFIAEWTVDERDCFEMREDRPWTFQPDYFGLAGIIYCMLFGKYIQNSSITTSASETGQKYRIATPFKRYWQGDLWTRLFDLLLNPCHVRPNARLPLCEEMGALRKEMETWLQNNCNRSSNTLKGLLKKIEVSVWRGSTR